MARYVLNLDSNSIQPFPFVDQRGFRSLRGKERIQKRFLTDGRIQRIYETNGFANIAIFKSRAALSKFREFVIDQEIPERINKNILFSRAIYQRITYRSTRDDYRALLNELIAELEVFQIFLEAYNNENGMEIRIDVFVAEADLDNALDELENWEPTLSFEFETQPIIGEINTELDVIFWSNTKQRRTLNYEYDLWTKERLN